MLAAITGGAGAIAAGLAERLIGKGYGLALIDKDGDRLVQRASTLGAAVETLQADLGEPGDIEKTCRFLGGLDDLALFVNNAGVIEPGFVADVPPGVLDRHVAINLAAPMRLTQAAAQGMVARGRGCILSVVSAAGLVALPGSAAYSASKFGLRGYLIALSQELAPFGVKVVSVFPGAVDTPMLRYEATHGGSVLNFLNRDVLSVDQVADACMGAIEGRRLETHLPFGDGVFARIACAFPGLLRQVLPALEKQGHAGLQRYLRSRGLDAGAASAPRV